MADFNKILKQTLLHEGGYSNDSHDLGGATYQGISRKYHPDWDGWAIVDQHVRLANFPTNLTTEDSLSAYVEKFYQTQFWEPLQGAAIHSDAVAASIFDFAVNAGIGTAIQLSCMTMEQPPTKTATNSWVAALNQQDPKQFLTGYFLAKTIRYHLIVQHRPESRRYFYGWIKRAIDFS